MNKKYPEWVENGNKANNYLSNMLEFGTANYARHTDWFLRHRNIGLRNLAALLTAEFAIVSLYLAKPDKFMLLSVFVLFLLAGLAPILSISACRSCRSSFQASLESALLVTKTVWAMGLVDPVSIDEVPHDNDRIPVCDDPSLYVPRYWRDARKHLTTDDFVRHHLQTWNNTYFMSKLTITVFCIAATATGIVTGIYILRYC